VIIILVASVVLGTAVVLFGTSEFQSETLKDEIVIRGTTLWVDPDDIEPSWGVAGIRNSGDKVLSVDTIRVRGAEVAVSDWFVDQDQTRVSVKNYGSFFFNPGYSGINGMLNDYDPDSDCSSADLAIDQDGTGGESAVCMTQRASPPILKPGERLIVYFKLPDNTLRPYDGGKDVAVAIFAGKAGTTKSTIVSTTP